MPHLGCFNTSSIRVVTLEGHPWFVAKDVYEALGFTYANLRYHIQNNLDESEKVIVKLTGFTGNGGSCISESGLYKLIMRSDKPLNFLRSDQATALVVELQSSELSIDPVQSIRGGSAQGVNRHHHRYRLSLHQHTLCSFRW